MLVGEPETWLAYLHGQQIDNLPLLTSKRPRYRGLFLQVAKFVALLFRDLRLKRPPELKRPAKFLIFAGSANQMGSLEQTIESLKARGEKLVCIADSRLLANKHEDKGYISCQLSVTDIARSFILFATRGLALYRELKARHPVSVSWHFANFCQVYIYLSYFYRVLSQVKPEFVITANDHNTPNRCMLAVAHHLGIKTVYLQHASVSPLFPALRVDYAFLDGQCALDTYLECEPNQPDTVRDVPMPQVILSGQKKHLRRSSGPHENVVGVALNAMDNTKAGIEFINVLVGKGLNVRLRWHPGQALRDTDQYREAFSNSQQVMLSDPRTEPISDFMEQIGWLIAGNSSIHLEAALAGVMPIYYELEPAELPDYYGYVKHGLTEPATSVTEILRLIQNTCDKYTPNAKAVRYYSSTYLTDWESREGDLVVECLERIFEGEALPVDVIEFEHTAKT
ncbi:hypothetical protein [Marinobacter sp. F3R11]|uniref:hypothetical protein n=1 Tax=Marinobacter sp. F3R11 TaxID=2267231 RepID=UPI0021CA61A4|nr:hypothetical protein [Marinobacter sp. F3R11]